MNVAKAVVWGFTLSIVLCVVIFAVGFLFQVDIGLPGMIAVTASKEGAPQADLQFNPLAPVIFTVVLSLLTWVVGYLRRRVAKSDR